jgi:hypothetical protein
VSIAITINSGRSQFLLQQNSTWQDGTITDPEKLRPSSMAKMML